MDDESPTGLLEYGNLLRNSVEIGQTSKGEWYTKSIELYFGSEEEEIVMVLGRLVRIKSELTAICSGIR